MKYFKGYWVIVLTPCDIQSWTRKIKKEKNWSAVTMFAGEFNPLCGSDTTSHVEKSIYKMSKGSRQVKFNKKFKHSIKRLSKLNSRFPFTEICLMSIYSLFMPRFLSWLNYIIRLLFLIQFTLSVLECHGLLVTWFKKWCFQCLFLNHIFLLNLNFNVYHHHHHHL